MEIRLVVDTLHEGCDAEPNLPRQLAERIGVQEQAIQRYEATGYFGASFGWSSPRAAEIAALTTRKAKQHDVDAATLRSRWREQARVMNFGPRELAAVMDQQPTEHRGLAEVRAIEAVLLSPAGLTKQSSSFDRRDVLLGVAEALRNGASVAYLEAIADRLLCHPEVVALAS